MHRVNSWERQCVIAYSREGDTQTTWRPRYSVLFWAYEIRLISPLLPISQAVKLEAHHLSEGGKSETRVHVAKSTDGMNEKINSLGCPSLDTQNLIQIAYIWRDIFIYICMCLHVCTFWLWGKHVTRGQRTVWLLHGFCRLELKSAEFAASYFTCWAISLAWVVHILNKPIIRNSPFPGNNLSKVLEGYGF